MTVLIDTNILLDWILEREPFFVASDKIIRLCSDGTINGCLAAHSITNAFFIMRKNYTVQERRDYLLGFCDFLSIIDIDEKKIISALENRTFKDFEDCLQAECAAACRADYIVTRNVEDFAGSKVRAIAPEELLKLADETDE